MDFLNVLLLLLAGGISGFLAGLFGIGGGIIFVPILLFYFHSIEVSSLVATHVALGTSLLVVVFASSASAYQHFKNGHVVWKGVLYLGVASIVGALLGATVASVLPGKTLQRIFAFVVTIAALRMLVEAHSSSGDPEPNLAPPGLSLAGFVAGLISSLTGIGGGILLVPMMYYFLKFPLKKSLGTSSATIVITATAGVVGYVIRGMDNTLLPPHTLGYVDYLNSIPLIIGTLLTARLGAMVAHKTNVNVLRKFFAVFLLVVATKMFFF